MQAKIIRTEADYDAALQRIDALMENDPEPTSADGEELELWSLLVERYENEKYPMDLPDPVSAIKFRMEQQGLKNKDLIPFIGSASKVSEVLSGHRTLSLSMIRNLVKGLGIPPECLIGTAGAVLKPDATVAEFRRYPLAQMVKRGYFPSFTGSTHEARSQLEDLFSAFLAVPGGHQRLALNRQHVRSGSQPDSYALAAWRIRVVGLALKESLPVYQKGCVTTEFLGELARLSRLDEGPKLAREYLNKSGIHVIIEPHLPQTHLDGAAIRMPDGSPLVALTLRHDRLDNFWFTLFHELAHVAKHLDKLDVEAFFDDLTDVGEEVIEKEADTLASEALIPAAQWKAARLGPKSSAREVQEFAEKLRLSQAIPAGRIRFEAKDYTLFRQQIGLGKVRAMLGVNKN